MKLLKQTVTNRKLKAFSSIEIENIKEFEALKRSIISKCCVYELFEQNLINDINESVQQCSEKLIELNDKKE